MAAEGGAGGPDAKPVAAAPSTLDSYEVLSTLGKGSFGTVSKVRRKADNRVSGREYSRHAVLFKKIGAGL